MANQRRRSSALGRLRQAIFLLFVPTRFHNGSTTYFCFAACFNFVGDENAARGECIAVYQTFIATVTILCMIRFLCFTTVFSCAFYYNIVYCNNIIITSYCVLNYLLFLQFCTCFNCFINFCLRGE